MWTGGGILLPYIRYFVSALLWLGTTMGIFGSAWPEPVDISRYSIPKLVL
jgi:hypothetical protein